MAKRIRMRRRDVKPKETPAPPKPPAVQEDIIRLERLLATQPPADLTPVEAQLRTMRGEISELRSILARMPEQKQQATNYRFVVHRRDDQLIDYVDGIAMSQNPTILERAAAKLH